MQRPQRTVPVPLFIGLVLGIYGTVTLVTAYLAGSYKHIDRWEHFSFGCELASQLLVTFGLFAISNRLYGWHRRVVQVACWLFVVGIAWMFARTVLSGLLFDSSSDVWFMVWRWGARVVGLLGFAALILLTLGLRSWLAVPTALAAGLLIVANILSGWVPYLGEWIWRQFDDHQKAAYVFWIGRDLLWCGALLWLVWRVPQATPDPRIAASGFRIATTAILARVVIGVLLALTTLGMLETEGSFKTLLVLAPAVGAAALLAGGAGLLRANTSALQGLPAVRIAIGAATLAWWAGVQLSQVGSLYRSMALSYEHYDPMLWTIAGPLVATVGMALVGSAISDFATHIGDSHLGTIATSRTVLVIVLSLVSIAMQLGLTIATTATSALGLAVIAALAMVAAQVILATLLAQTASAIEQAPGLPHARIR